MITLGFSGVMFARDPRESYIACLDKAYNIIWVTIETICVLV